MDEKSTKNATADKKAVVKKEIKKEVKKVEDTFIMKVSHLSWGRNNNNHFYSNKKPLITEKVMGNYSDILLTWIEQGWIEEGTYK